MTWLITLALALPPGCEETTELPSKWPAPLPVESWMTDAARSSMRRASATNDEAWRAATEMGERIQCGPVRILRYDYGGGLAIVAETAEAYLLVEVQSPRGGEPDEDAALPLTRKGESYELAPEPDVGAVRLRWDRAKGVSLWSCSSGDTHSTCPWGGRLEGELTASGRPSGSWKWFIDDAVIVEGVYVDGVANGPASLRGGGGLVVRGTVNSGERVGDWVTEAPGQPAVVRRYVDMPSIADDCSAIAGIVVPPTAEPGGYGPAGQEQVSECRPEPWQYWFYVDRRPLLDELESYAITETEWLAAAADAGWTPVSEARDPALLHNDAFPGWRIELQVFGDPVAQVWVKLQPVPAPAQ